jgi:hypothetical protein
VAQKISVMLVDDLDGSDAVETLTFALDGAEYEIDLSAKNAASLRDALAKYVAAGRKSRAGSKRRPQARSGRSGSTASGIRAWARANGWEVSERGRVSAEVKAAYDAAH